MKRFYTIYLPLFCLSGFAGLIYESIWAHYFKLILGNASYAQLLVLVTFMGGMSLGSWIIGQESLKIKNLLRTYAVVEALLGIASLVFHYVFLNLQNFIYEVLSFNLENPLLLRAALWAGGALIILPQTILLGTTFPLMTGAMIRRYDKSPGKTIALLYFVNSLGGAIGILISSFVLMHYLGLPGILIFTGVFNLFIAAILWHLSTHRERIYLPEETSSFATTTTTTQTKTNTIQAETSMTQAKTQTETNTNQVKTKTTTATERNYSFTIIFLLFGAGITGFASFCYEIGSIRMLSMLLGSSTHSFELMLSAFILGIALGGLCIYYALPKMRSPIVSLGYIQIIMGISAVLTIPIYNHLFGWMEKFLVSLPRTEENYIFLQSFNPCAMFYFDASYYLIGRNESPTFYAYSLKKRTR